MRSSPTSTVDAHGHVLDPRHQRDRAEAEDGREQTGEQADKRGRAAAVDEAGGDHEERHHDDPGVPGDVQRDAQERLGQDDEVGEDRDEQHVAKGERPEDGVSRGRRGVP